MKMLSSRNRPFIVLVPAVICFLLFALYISSSRDDPVPVNIPIAPKSASKELAPVQSQLQFEAMKEDYKRIGDNMINSVAAKSKLFAHGEVDTIIDNLEKRTELESLAENAIANPSSLVRNLNRDEFESVKRNGAFGMVPPAVNLEEKTAEISLDKVLKKAAQIQAESAPAPQSASAFAQAAPDPQHHATSPLPGAEAKVETKAADANLFDADNDDPEVAEKENGEPDLTSLTEVEYRRLANRVRVFRDEDEMAKMKSVDNDNDDPVVQ